MSEQTHTLFTIPGNKKVRVSNSPADWPGPNEGGNVPRDAILPDPEQSRKEFSETEMEKLVLSMRSLGQLEPITVRKLPTAERKKLPAQFKEARYMIVGGERRWRASAPDQANIPVLEVRVKKYSLEERRVVGLTINFNRVDLNPIEVATELQIIKKGEKFTTATALAKHIGMGEVTVGRYLSLNNLNSRAKTLIKAGGLARMVGYELAKVIGHKEQDRLIDTLLQNNWPAQRQAQWVREQATIRGVSNVKRRDIFREPRKNREIAINLFAAAAQKAAMLLHLSKKELIAMFTDIPTGTIEDFLMQIENAEEVLCKLQKTLQTAAAKAQKSGTTSGKQVAEILPSFVVVDYYDENDYLVAGTAVGSRKYRSLWNTKRLVFQRKGKEKPPHLPTPNQLDAKAAGASCF